MKIYLSAAQKSSNPHQFSLSRYYGLSPSVAAAAIVQGKTAHARYYEAALRLGIVNLVFNTKEFCQWLNANAIPISMATAQRVLVDTTFFCFMGKDKTGKKGRPNNLYALVKPSKVGEKLGLPLGDSWNAPELSAVDLSSGLSYKLAILGRYMKWEDNSPRQQQIEFWGWSKPTLIRWTREVCDIIPRIKRISSDSLNFTSPSHGDEVFLEEVRQREYPRDRRYWLEVVNGAGEIRKLPCKVEIAARWLPRSVITLCEQLPNQYRVRAAYCDPPVWEDGGPLPY